MRTRNSKQFFNVINCQKLILNIILKKGSLAIFRVIWRKKAIKDSIFIATIQYVNIKII